MTTRDQSSTTLLSIPQVMGLMKPSGSGGEYS
jgi:hypothetical protein